MLTFASLGGPVIHFKVDSKSLLVFPKHEKGVEKKADIVLLSAPEEEPTEGIISWPGEFDIGGIAIRGIGHNEGAQVSYAIEAEGARCAFLSTPLCDLTDHDLELLGDVDILVIPADDAKVVQKLVDEIDPRVLIPLPTKDEKTFEEVLKNAGAKENEIIDEYNQKGSLPAEGREVVILKPKK